MDSFTVSRSPSTPAHSHPQHAQALPLGVIHPPSAVSLIQQPDSATTRLRFPSSCIPKYPPGTPTASLLSSRLWVQSTGGRVPRVGTGAPDAEVLERRRSSFRDSHPFRHDLPDLKRPPEHEVLSGHSCKIETDTSSSCTVVWLPPWTLPTILVERPHFQEALPWLSSRSLRHILVALPPAGATRCQTSSTAARVLR